MSQPLAPIAAELRAALAEDQRDPALILALVMVFGIDLLDELERLWRAPRRPTSPARAARPGKLPLRRT